MIESLAEIEKQGSLTVDDFFNQFKLKISDYQRPYVWTEKQIIKLYNDLSNYSRKNKNKCPLYYLGTVILVKNKEGKTYDIIDGQQRISSLLILAHLQEQSVGLNDNFCVESEISRNNIKKNVSFLKDHIDGLKLMEAYTGIDFSDINITYIIAESQDQAFKFYTTLNTSGRRLDGIDIIKPFHLQALEKSKQIEKALDLEYYQFDSAKLNQMSELLLKARYWQGIKFREFPRHNFQEWKLRLPEEFAYEEMLPDKDYKFAEACLSKGKLTVDAPNYKVRQPLYKGENTIHYLIYYCEIWDRLEEKLNSDHSDILNRIKKLRGCEFNYEYYQMVLITLISRYGEGFIEDRSFMGMAQLLFKVCFFKRLSKPVTKKIVHNFEEGEKLLDRIYYSHDLAEIVTYCKKKKYSNLSISKDHTEGVVGNFYNEFKDILMNKQIDNV
ncbi:DUF262 domain-containing protein [Chryseobacterium herbae]|uniref:DUF262 domain-containing protein n=1 Tax=Chryseobacterium herbae TaxID=2976476 RepID=A0ABT2IT26_9FLAO|nr:DUF262 domain-containing protein [Chryseobacterium sp. pc1-10]MCT2561979.1 DUF262 domain-containing protein [Chryseobacterium sp. pc1-10]